MSGGPQVKICGLTRPEEATACAALGAAAIGCVFYPPSPRHVSRKRARTIAGAIDGSGCRLVGVFVDAAFTEVMQTVEACHLDAVQLHGRETPERVAAVAGQGIPVIKTLFVDASPSFADGPSYAPSAFLVECSGGPLPGGNAVVWQWGAAVEMAERYPLVLAGGLRPENVAEAIAAARPDAVDVSSGVEAKPGRKDLTRVKHFLEAAHACRIPTTHRRIFQ